MKSANLHRMGLKGNQAHCETNVDAAAVAWPRSENQPALVIGVVQNTGRVSREVVMVSLRRRLVHQAETPVSAEMQNTFVDDAG